MATKAITRSFFILNCNSSSIAFCRRLFFVSHSHFPSFSPLLPFTPLSPSPTSKPFSTLSIKPTVTTSFCTTPTSEPPTTTTTAATKPNTKVNFSLSDSDSESDSENLIQKPKEIDKSKMPPPYDPFNKKPAIQEPEDPTNLQEVFHRIRSEGLFNNAVKMFDGLSKDGLTHEALELFSQIKDKGEMPEVVAHTAVIEAYANAGKAKEAHRVYLRMLASGVLPNAYTYSVLIKGLAGSGDGKLVNEAQKYILEMVGKGMRVNAGTYVAVVEGLVKLKKEEEGKELVEELKGKGMVPDEKAVREVMGGKRGPVSRSVMNIIFSR